MKKKSKSIKELKAEIARLEKKNHNTIVKNTAKQYREELLEKMTAAELKFQHVANLKNIELIPQHIIYKSIQGYIKRFYIVDFIDPINRYIFEIDGEYHNDLEQIEKDNLRTKDLKNLGYKVFRISNEDVYNGLTTAFLYKIYKFKIEQ